MHYRHPYILLPSALYYMVPLFCTLFAHYIAYPGFEHSHSSGIWHTFVTPLSAKCVTGCAILSWPGCVKQYTPPRETPQDYHLQPGFTEPYPVVILFGSCQNPVGILTLDVNHQFEQGVTLQDMTSRGIPPLLWPVIQSDVILFIRVFQRTFYSSEHCIPKRKWGLPRIFKIGLHPFRN